MDRSEFPRRRVLVAEDVAAIAELMRMLLTTDGYDVEIAEDGEQCLKRALATAPDLVILDIMMPKIHGLDVLKELKNAPDLGETLFIICTAKDYKPDLDRARELGADAILKKPFQVDEFRRLVNEMLQRNATSRPPPLPSAEVELYTPALDDSSLSFHLWGTRGSIPISSAPYLRHGGNTTCASFECGDDLVVIDAGTGIRELGLALARGRPRRIHLFISHTHWDHIQGFPFFAPIYIPGFEIIVHGASGYGRDLASIFRDQLDRDYFPVQMQDMRSNLDFSHLGDSPMRVGEITVHWECTHHPSAALGFKIEARDRRVVFLCDNEFLMGYLGHPVKALANGELLAPYSKIVEFVAGSDLLIGEAQYTNDEYPAKVGWGHSSVSNACLLATLAGVSKWIVVHHDPMHDDEFLQRKLLLTRRVFDDLNHEIEVEHGFDGMIGRLR